MSGSGASAVVRAAGAVCWRREGRELRVLLVHRPAYDDWSWPKGKLDPGEGVAVAAVREVAEETGLQVRLGVPLPTARYRLSDDADKHVAYWAAQLPKGRLPPPPRPREVDRTEWVAPREAQRRLTRRGDRVQLQALLDADADGALETWPLVVLRHGHAYPRSAWGREDAERPLAEAGSRQADALTDLLAVWRPERVWSSPWRRCTDTVLPYTKNHPARLVTKRRLSEEGHRRNPQKVADLIGKVVGVGRPAVVCTHRPVLGTLLGALAGRAAAGTSLEVPTRDPFLAPGEALVAHVAVRTGRVVSVERHRPLT
ncbi:NUDIX hydrolase [Thalassiella azotivora]